MIRTLIVDDSALIRLSIKMFVGYKNGISIVGECADGDEVLDFLSREQVDVILMDIRMNRMGGIEATKLVKEQYPSIKIIAYTMNDEDIFKRKMKEAGATDYLLKESGLEKMRNTIYNSMSTGN